ncbi:DUF4145 domain-containing protein [Bacillus sp. C1]
MERIDQQLYCYSCKKKTNHMHVQNNEGKKLEYIKLATPEESQDFQYRDSYSIVQCLGCDEVSFLRAYCDEDMLKIGYDGNWESYEEYTVYPEEPKEETKGLYLEYKSIYEFNNIPDFIFDLREEVIEAYRKEMFLLCSMGIRMLLEGICKEKGIVQIQKIKNKELQFDKSGNPEMRNLSLHEKIEELHKQQYIIESHKGVLHQVRGMGNYAAHEMITYSPETIAQALKIIEHMLYSIYEIPHTKIEK